MGSCQCVPEWHLWRRCPNIASATELGSRCRCTGSGVPAFRCGNKAWAAVGGLAIALLFRRRRRRFNIRRCRWSAASVLGSGRRHRRGFVECRIVKAKWWFIRQLDCQRRTTGRIFHCSFRADDMSCIDGGEAASLDTGVGHGTAVHGVGLLARVVVQNRTLLGLGNGIVNQRQHRCW